MHFSPEEINAFMVEALKAANLAFQNNEVPVGAIIVDSKTKTIVSSSSNTSESSFDPTAHAEILAIRKASSQIKNWRLESCALFVTIEPCTMCAGAILQSRIPLVVFGCNEPQTGAAGSCYDLLTTNNVRVISGILKDESQALMQSFFKARRQ